MALFDPGELSRRDSYLLLTSLFVPRPIAFVGTCSANGALNCAPFSSTAGVSSAPPMLIVSIGDKGRGQKKDTLVNIEETGVFTINLVNEDIMEAMHQSSSPFPPDVSEFDEVGLTVLVSEKISAPGIAESPVTMEMKLRQLIRLDDARVTLVLGEVVLFHVRDEVLKDGVVCAETMKPVGRLGKDAYVVVREATQLPPVS